MKTRRPSGTGRAKNVLRRHWGVVVICLLGLALRLIAPGPTTETIDEDLWLHRSQTFGTAIVHGDFARATPLGVEVARGPIPTMPGVTTMWAGTTGRLLAKSTAKLGLSAPVTQPSWLSPQVLRASRAMISLMVMAALAVIVLAATRLFGRATAWLAGAVLATEPWLVGHGALLHTDALVTYFGAASVLSAAVGFGLTAWRATDNGGDTAPVSGRWAVLSAVCGALAVLTKANALGIVGPGLAVVAVWALGQRWRQRGSATSLTAHDLRAVLTVIACWLGVAVLVCLVIWPALWIDPRHQLTGVWNTVSQAELPRPKFFHGEVTTTPGSAFYPVTLAFRLTPWALLLATVGALGWVLAMISTIAKWASNNRRWTAQTGLAPTWLVWTLVPYIVVMATSPNKYDRYFMPVVPMLVIAGSIPVAHVARELQRYLSSRVSLRRSLRFAAISVVIIVLSSGSVALAPYALNYANPMFGGQRAAERWIPLGWGESAAALGAEINRREAGSCDQITVANLWRLPLSVPCGRAIEPGNPEQLATANYAITLIAIRQRGSFAWYQEWLEANATRIDVVTIDGVVYGELWKLPPSQT